MVTIVHMALGIGPTIIDSGDRIVLDQAPSTLAMELSLFITSR